MLKRRREEWPLEKMIPETWFLINRSHALPEAAMLYRWGCYYFDFQKQYGESARLIRLAEKNGTGGFWLDFYRALDLLRRNDFARAEALLLAVAEAYGRDGGRAEAGSPAEAVRDRGGGSFWPVLANLGRIREAARSFGEALGYYQAAASLAGGADAARIWYRAAGCLRALGRDREARAALEQGLSLDGENLPIRLELTRLNELGIF
jgi:tetratricopeptide (TPR) repeat protein